MAGAQDTESTTRPRWESLLHRGAAEKAGTSIPPSMTLVPPGKEQPITVDAGEALDKLVAKKLGATEAQTIAAPARLQRAAETVLNKMKKD